MPENLSEVPESLPVDDQAAPSAAQTQEAPQTTEQAPPPSSQPVSPPEEPPFHQHPRWQEMQQEKRVLQDQNRQLLETLQRVAQPQGQPQPQVEVDPYAGMEPQTADFYRQMDRRIEQKAAQIAAQQVQPLQQALVAGQRQLVGITISKFYQDNPDVVPNSPEAEAIANLVHPPDGSPGLQLEHAKWVVMGPKYAQQARAGTQRVNTQQQRQTAVRQAAPEHGSGIPSTAGAINQPQRSFRETLAAELT